VQRGSGGILGGRRACVRSVAKTDREKLLVRRSISVKLCRQGDDEPDQRLLCRLRHCGGR
jgi:hypothetical protein